MTQEVPKSRIAWFVALAATGCAADLWTKSWVFAWPALQRPGAIWWIWQGHFGIQRSLNEGALFGMGQGRVAIFAALAGIAAVAVPVWLFVFGGARDKFLCFVLALVMGGILGNLYDRLGLHGLQWNAFNPDRAGEPVYAVRDWILWQVNNQWRWPNFNIADSLLVSGACLLFVHAFWQGNIEANTQGAKAGNVVPNPKDA